MRSSAVSLIQSQEAVIVKLKEQRQHFRKENELLRFKNRIFKEELLLDFFRSNRGTEDLRKVIKELDTNKQLLQQECTDLRGAEREATQTIINRKIIQLNKLREELREINNEELFHRKRSKLTNQTQASMN